MALAEGQRRTCGHLRLFSWDVPDHGVFVRGQPDELDTFYGDAIRVFRAADDAVSQEMWQSFDWFGPESDTVLPLERLWAGLADLASPSDVGKVDAAFAGPLASPPTGEVLFVCRNGRGPQEFAYGGLFRNHEGAEQAYWAAHEIAESGHWPVGDPEALQDRPFAQVYASIDWIAPGPALAWLDSTVRGAAIEDI